MIQGAGEVDRVVPVFDSAVWLTGFRRAAMLPDVLGAALAPTAPGRAPFRVVGTGGWSGGLWQGAEPPSQPLGLLPEPDVGGRRWSAGLAGEISGRCVGWPTLRPSPATRST
jgi:hypothetical protein